MLPDTTFCGAKYRELLSISCLFKVLPASHRGSLKTLGSSSSIESKHCGARCRSLRSSCLNVAPPMLDDYRVPAHRHARSASRGDRGHRTTCGVGDRPHLSIERWDEYHTCVTTRTQNQAGTLHFEKRERLIGSEKVKM